MITTIIIFCAQALIISTIFPPHTSHLSLQYKFIRNINPVFDIFKTIAIPIISNAPIANIIASKTLKVPPISSSKFTIFLSAIGSTIAAEKLYRILKTVSFTIGIAQIPITTTIPTIPTAFFITDVAP